MFAAVDRTEQNFIEDALAAMRAEDINNLTVECDMK